MDIPWSRTVTITSANTNYTLLTLAQAVDPTVTNNVSIVSIQADSSVQATYRLGNSSLSNTDYGVALSNFQMFGMAQEANIIILGNMYVRCNIAGQRLHLTLVVR